MSGFLKDAGYHGIGCVDSVCNEDALHGGKMLRECAAIGALADMVLEFDGLTGREFAR
jgi:hypothetical protein